MPENPFPYPGGKAYLAPWIVRHMKRHHGYVEVFAGSAAVLFAKPESPSEIINDQDGDVTHFFHVLRNSRPELVEWLKDVPYSRDLHERWAEEFYAGERFEDDIKRAGRFFFLRYTQFAGKYRTKSGFSSASRRDQATKFRNATEKLEQFAERLRPVQIENRDYSVMFDRFDGADTLFYCDPPYVGPGDALYSHEGNFDHEKFVGSLHDLEANWIVSYEEVPAELMRESTYVVERRRAQYMSKGYREEDRKQHGTERLVMNYNPNETAMHQQPEQMTLTDGGYADKNQSEEP